MRLNCKACGSEKSMIATEIHKFSKIVVIVGKVLLVPTLAGILFAAFSFGLYLDADSPASGIGAGVSVFLGLVSFVGGLLGYILIMKKKVWKCAKCGSVIDRA